MTARTSAAESAADEAWELLEQVLDPELPVLSVVDLGIARAVSLSDDGRAVEVTITPTYSGCPAMAAIETAVQEGLAARFDAVSVRTVLSPAWTTDWMTAAGRDKLSAYGVAPPSPHRGGPVPVTIGRRPTDAAAGAPAACPQCSSGDVERISEFGSTACKSMWRCRACREPFDYFKRH